MAKTSPRSRAGWIFGITLLLALLLLFPVYRQVRQERLDTALFAAVRSSKASDVRQLLAQGADARARKETGNAFHLSIWDRLRQPFTKSSGASADTITPLLAATETREDEVDRGLVFPSDYARIFQALLKRGARPNVRDQGGRTPLLAISKIACHPVDAQACRILLQYGADVNVRDYSGTTALMYASESGSTEIVRDLLQHGADVNATTFGNIATALTSAFNADKPEIIQILLDAGANPLLGFRKNYTAENMCRYRLNSTRDDARKARYTAILHQLQQPKAVGPAALP